MFRQIELNETLPEAIVINGDGTDHELLLSENLQEADAFIALPGGWGTLEEITEVITLKQLGIHNKPIIFLNTNDFYEYFFLFINNIRKEGFVSKAYDGLYVVVNTVEEAVEYIENYQAKDFSSKY